MKSTNKRATKLNRCFAAIVFACAASLGVIPMQVSLASALQATDAPAPVVGPPGFAMAEPAAGAPSTPTRAPSRPLINASYTHTPAQNSGQNLPPGSGNIMPSATVYYDFWLGTAAGATYEGSAAGNTSYETLLTRFASDLGASQFHNLLTQYYGNNGTIQQYGKPGRFVG